MKSAKEQRAANSGRAAIGANSLNGSFRLRIFIILA